MQFENQNWKIEKLIEEYDNDNIDLSPPYQRNYIWSSKAQKKLIKTINDGQPIPNFFLLKKENNKFEMVDGQQRARTILGFYKKQIKDDQKKEYDDNQEFKNYILNITILFDLGENESIETYYALVNSSGMGLNRPELLTAKYYDTNFLALIHEIALSDILNDLNLFSMKASERMNDQDFISELVALLMFGISDKKDKVNYLFENDITESKSIELKEKFNEILEVINDFNIISPLKGTRYKQRNDFYTLFNFVNENISVDIEVLKYFYETLVYIGPSISPSQEDCDPLLEYAIHCVTQSNSKKARLVRSDFFNKLFLNKSNQLNDTQLMIVEYFGSDENSLIKKSDFTVIDITKFN